MAWQVEYTDEFEAWWNALTETDELVPKADALYDAHLAALEAEGLLPQRET